MSSKRSPKVARTCLRPWGKAPRQAVIVGLLLGAPRRHERLKFLARLFPLVLKVSVLRRLVTRAVL